MEVINFLVSLFGSVWSALLSVDTYFGISLGLLLFALLAYDLFMDFFVGLFVPSTKDRAGSIYSKYKKYSERRRNELVQDTINRGDI